jgi:dihydrofolate reductase
VDICRRAEERADRRGRRIVDELTIIIAPVVLGGGKRLFEGFTQSLDLEHRGVRQSPFATFIDYAVKP